MCPLTKEFGATIGFRAYCPLVLPFVSKDLSSLHIRVLGLIKDDVSTTLIEDEVDFVSLISYFGKGNKQPIEGVYRQRVILILSYHALFTCRWL